MALLLVTDGRSNDFIQLPRDQVIEPAMNAQALAVDLDKVLEAASQRIFGGDRAGAVGLLNQARFRIQSFRAEWHRIAGIAEAAPACMDGVLTFQPDPKPARELVPV